MCVLCRVVWAYSTASGSVTHHGKSGQTDRYIVDICCLSRPAYGGAHCLGVRKRVRTCNTQACPDGSKSYRQQKCEQLRSSGRADEWEAVSDGECWCTIVSTPASSFLALVPGVALQGCLLLSTHAGGVLLALAAKYILDSCSLICVCGCRGRKLLS